jgi:hypothetical protein
VRAVQVERLLTDENHRAVDAASHDRGDLFRRHSNHRLIEQRQTLSVSPHHNERAALPQPTERYEVGFTEPLTDGDRVSERVVSLCGIALFEGPQRQRDQEKAPFNAVEPVIVNQPLSTADPTTAPRHLAAAKKAGGQPERAPHRPLDLSCFEELKVGALPRRRGQLVLSDQLRSDRQPFQVLGHERLLGVSG